MRCPKTESPPLRLRLAVKRKKDGKNAHTHCAPQKHSQAPRVRRAGPAHPPNANPTRSLIIGTQFRLSCEILECMRMILRHDGRPTLPCGIRVVPKGSTSLQPPGSRSQGQSHAAGNSPCGGPTAAGKHNGAARAAVLASSMPPGSSMSLRPWRPPIPC